MCGASKGPSMVAYCTSTRHKAAGRASQEDSHTMFGAHLGGVEAKPRLENGRKTSCVKGLSKKIRVHAFGDCCTVVVFTIIAVPEDNLVGTAVCQL